jgi:hypothetical protein
MRLNGNLFSSKTFCSFRKTYYFWSLTIYANFCAIGRNLEWQSLSSLAKSPWKWLWMKTCGIFCLCALRATRNITLRSEGRWKKRINGGFSYIGFIFVLLCLFLVVMTVKSLSSAISSRLGGSEEAFADNAGFCAPCLAALVPLGRSVYLQPL